MVCVPCFIIPVILFFWRWLIQPYFIKYIWNPWEKKDKDGNVIKDEPEFIQKCEGGVCTFMRKPKEDNTTSPHTTEVSGTCPVSKKDD
jgi:hypothetical protein